MSRLIVISAPSGAGKTTLCAKLLETTQDLALSISCTTRPPRGAEKHGKDYFFLSQEEFQRRIQAGEFAEWAQVHGNFYGTLRSTIEDFFKRGKSVLLDIDVQGAESLRLAFPDRSTTIFIAPPSIEILEQRLRSRGTDSEEAVQKRMINARAEMTESKKFDCTIVNDDFDRAFQQLSSFLKEETKNRGQHG